MLHVCGCAARGFSAVVHTKIAFPRMNAANEAKPVQGSTSKWRERRMRTGKRRRSKCTSQRRWQQRYAYHRAKPRLQYHLPRLSTPSTLLPVLLSLSLWLYPRFSEHSESDRNLGIPFRIRSDSECEFLNGISFVLGKNSPALGMAPECRSAAPPRL